MGTGEQRVYIAVSGLALATYLLFGLVLPHVFRPARFYFGFNQLKHPGVATTVALCGVGAVLVWLYRVRRPSAVRLAKSVQAHLLASGWGVFGVAASSAVVFFVLSSNALNQDSLDLIDKIPRDVAATGAHVTHDEMWELWLHSKFWQVTNRMFGWGVTLSYQMLSSLAGGLFVGLLLAYARLIRPGRALPLAALVATGGFMQLFFGDPENYTLTAVLVMAYFLAAAAHLRGRCLLVVPSTLLALAMTFHLLAGWLGPSLAYLHLLELRRGRYRPVLAGVVGFAAVIGSTLLFFSLSGLPLADLFGESHAFGHGGNFLSMLARPSFLHYTGVVNLLFLLAPAAWLIPPLLLFRRIDSSPTHVHLLLASGFMLAFMFSWNPMLGIYSDWNLFAIAGIPISLLVYANVIRNDDLAGRGELLLGLGWIFAMHSYSWIVSNHFHP